MNKKENKLVLKAISLCENTEAKKLLEEALIVSDKMDLYKFCTPRKHLGRENLKGVYYKDGYAVATDGYVLVKLKTEYDESLEGKIIGKDGNVIKERYVNYDHIFEIENYHDVSINWNKVLSAELYCEIAGNYYDAKKLKNIHTLFNKIYSTLDSIFSKNEDGSGFVLMKMILSDEDKRKSVDCN